MEKLRCGNEGCVGEGCVGEKRISTDPQDYVPGTVFHEWREYQRETVEWAVQEFENTRRIVAFDGPTGCGKSLTGVAVGAALGVRTIYLCHSKQLQDQLVRDFPRAAVLKGRSNYPCKAMKGLTCDLCSHDPKSPCMFAGKMEFDDNGVFLRWNPRPECHYKLAKIKALEADVLIANYALFLHEANYVGALSGRPLMVIDEADMIDGALVGHVSLAVTRKDIDKYDLGYPEDEDSLPSWIQWSDGALMVMSDVVEALRSDIQEYIFSGGNPPKERVAEIRRAKTVYGKIKMFNSWVEDDWVLDNTVEDQWVFKPIWADKLAERLLLRHSQHILAMSGTMPRPKFWGSDLGVDPSLIAYREIESTFPVENRPIVITNSVEMRYYRNKADRIDKVYKKMMPDVDAILDYHTDHRGIVHTVSNEIRDYIMQNSRHSHRMVSHDTKSRGDVAKHFMEDTSGYPQVLVSPSFSRGLDLKDDRGRFQIVTKIPYASLGDLQTKTRLNDGERGNNWYNGMAARDLVQMAGRVVRSLDDWGKTYIIDARFRRFYMDNLRFFPDNFKRAVTFADPDHIPLQRNN